MDCRVLEKYKRSEGHFVGDPQGRGKCLVTSGKPGRASEQVGTDGVQTLKSGAQTSEWQLCSPHKALSNSLMGLHFPTVQCD